MWDFKKKALSKYCFKYFYLWLACLWQKRRERGQIWKTKAEESVSQIDVEASTTVTLEGCWTCFKHKLNHCVHWYRIIIIHFGNILPEKKINWNTYNHFTTKCHRCVSLAQTLEEEEGAFVDLPLGVVAECQVLCVQQCNPKFRLKSVNLKKTYRHNVHDPDQRNSYISCVLLQLLFSAMSNKGVTRLGERLTRRGLSRTLSHSRNSVSLIAGEDRLPLSNTAWRKADFTSTV